MVRTTVGLVDIAVAVLCHTSIDPVEAVAPDLAEAETEAGRPGLEVVEPGSCATSYQQVKARQLMLIAFFLSS